MGASEGKTAETDAIEYFGDVKFDKRKSKEDSCYLNEDLSDFTIRVKHSLGTWRFPCHKLVLRNQKNLLATQCEKCNTNELTVTDVQPRIMEMVLRYTYENEIVLDDWTMACKVVKAASHYQMQSLVQECEDFLMKSLTLRNVCYILAKSDSLSLSGLKDKCLELCKNVGFIALNTNAFLLLPQSLVKEILKVDGLNILGEYSVFRSLWTWSQIRCIREFLPLTEKNIGTKFSNVADCVTFGHMSEKQKDLLPEFVRWKYLQENAAADKTPKRYFEFPLKLPKHFYFSLEFNERTLDADPVFGSFVCCIKFQVKLDAYLVSLSTLCLKKDRCTDTVEELRLSSPSGMVCSWNKKNEDCVKKIRSAHHVFSVDDSTMVTETEFQAACPLPLYVGLMYTLEITPEKDLRWPQVIPEINRRQSDLEIALCSTLCCGLKTVVFVQGK